MQPITKEILISSVSILATVLFVILNGISPRSFSFENLPLAIYVLMIQIPLTTFILSKLRHINNDSPNSWKAVKFGVVEWGIPWGTANALRDLLLDRPDNLLAPFIAIPIGMLVGLVVFFMIRKSFYEYKPKAKFLKK